eukprot:1699541-Alexandrium_andersonii.AAC.1
MPWLGLQMAQRLRTGGAAECGHGASPGRAARGRGRRPEGPPHEGQAGGAQGRRGRRGLRLPTGRHARRCRAP